MNKLIYLLLITILLSCSSNSEEKQNVNQTEVVNFLNDTLYRYKKFRGVLADEWLEDKELEKYFLLNSISENFLLNHKNSPMTAPYYGTRCVAFQNKIGDIQPIIVYISSDDYSSYVMVLLDANNNPINYKEIAGGWFFSPNEKDTVVEFHEKRFCNIIDDKMIDYFVTREIGLVGSDSVVGDPVFKDSISYKIEIHKSGKFITTLIDSLRIPISGKSDL